MKKTYMTPSQKIASLDMEMMIAQSNDAAVAAFEAVGDEYNAEDESYAKGDKGNLWDDLW